MDGSALKCWQFLIYPGPGDAQQKLCPAGVVPLGLRTFLSPSAPGCFGVGWCHTWVSTGHQGLCCLCPRGSAVLVGSISSVFLPWVSAPFVPHPSTALPLHFASFWAVWAPWSFSTHEGLLTPPLLQMLKEGGRCWDSQTQVKALMDLSRQGWVLGGLGLAGQRGLHPLFAPCSLQDLAQHPAPGFASATTIPQPSLQGLAVDLNSHLFLEICLLGEFAPSFSRGTVRG